jgi:hypothetical protein
MIEIEWDGLELEPVERRALFERVRWLGSRVSDHTRVRLEVRQRGGRFEVRIAGSEGERAFDVRARDLHLRVALFRAGELAESRRGRAA